MGRTKNNSEQDEREKDWQSSEIDWNKSDKQFDTLNVTTITTTTIPQAQANGKTVKPKQQRKKQVFKKKANGKNATGVPKKYTLEFCKKEAKWMLDLLMGGTPEGNKILFIGELCLLRGYSHQRWSEWKNQYFQDAYFTDTIKKVEEFLENRLAKAGISGLANPIMTIFTLKNKYNWKDKHEIDTNANLTQINFNLALLSKEELLKLDETITKALPPPSSGQGRTV